MKKRLFLAFLALLSIVPFLGNKAKAQVDKYVDYDYYDGNGLENYKVSYYASDDSLDLTQGILLPKGRVIYIDAKEKYVDELIEYLDDLSTYSTIPGSTLEIYVQNNDLLSKTITLTNDYRNELIEVLDGYVFYSSANYDNEGYALGALHFDLNTKDNASSVKVDYNFSMVNVVDNADGDYLDLSINVYRDYNDLYNFYEMSMSVDESLFKETTNNHTDGYDFNYVLDRYLEDYTIELLINGEVVKDFQNDGKNNYCFDYTPKSLSDEDKVKTISANLKFSIDGKQYILKSKEYDMPDVIDGYFYIDGRNNDALTSHIKKGKTHNIEFCAFVDNNKLNAKSISWEVNYYDDDAPLFDENYLRSHMYDLNFKYNFEYNAGIYLNKVGFEYNGINIYLENRYLYLYLDGEETKIDYDEEYFESYDRYVRDYYLDESYNAKFDISFSAPFGKKATINCNNSFLDIANMEIENIPGRHLESNLWVSYYQVVDGTEYYRNSMSLNSIYDLKKGLDGMVAFDSQDKEKSYRLGGYILVEVYGEKEYWLQFHLGEVDLSPTKEEDILKLDYYYYDSDVDGINEERINMSSVINDELFKELPTDGRKFDRSRNKYAENATLKFIANGHSIIKEVNLMDESDYSDIELWGYPNSPMNIMLELSFKSGGREYVYYSNEVLLAKLEAFILLDGFSKRDTVGVGTKHDLSAIAYIDGQMVKNFTPVFNFSIHKKDTMEEILENEEAEVLSFSFLEEGDYVVRCMATYEMFVETSEYGQPVLSFVREFEIHAVKDEPEYTDISKALTIDSNEDVNVILGGKSVTINAFIAEDILNDIDEVIYTWELSNYGILSMEVNGSSITFYPEHEGYVSINLKVQSNSIGTLTKTINVRVVDFAGKEIRVTYPEGFHKSGENILVSLSIGGYTNFANIDCIWEMVDANGLPVAFKNNQDGTIELVGPSQNDFMISCELFGDKILADKLMVRNKDMNKVVRKALPFIALAMVALFVLFILFRNFLTKTHTLDKRISKVIDAMNNINVTEDDFAKATHKVDMLIKKSLEKADDLNIQNFGQYDQIRKYLIQAHRIIKASTKKNLELSEEKKQMILDNIKENQIDKALALSIDIEEARIKINENHRKANENNIAKVKEEKEKKKEK